MKVLILLFLLVAAVAGAQNETSSQDRWAPFGRLIGSWQGSGQSQAGTSTVTTEFAVVLDNQYLRISNRSVIAAQEKTPNGEVHEDVGYISYDQQRDKYVLREFLSEGYVNQYTLDSLGTDPLELVFISESLENAPEGMTARLRYQLSGNDTLRSWFDLAFPEKDYTCFIQQELTRKQ